MKLLIVNTLPKDCPEALEAVNELMKAVSDVRVINAYEMNISPCIGCNACWLVTPGICSVKDGYEDILKGCIECENVIFLSGTALNFVDHRMKNVIDRLLPLATMYVHIVDGQCRHVPRYNRKYRFGLLYSGEADRDYLNEWLARVALNFGGESMSAVPIAHTREVLPCIL